MLTTDLSDGKIQQNHIFIFIMLNKLS